METYLCSFFARAKEGVDCLELFVRRCDQLVAAFALGAPIQCIASFDRRSEGRLRDGFGTCFKERRVLEHSQESQLG